MAAPRSYVDVILEVDTYPTEDSASRALSVGRSRGGNSATSAVVLAQLVRAACSKSTSVVSWMGVAPGPADADGAFALRELAQASNPSWGLG